MTERPNPFEKEYMNDIPPGTSLDKAIGLASTPQKFKSLLGYLMEEVKIESLLEDRVSQARLDVLLGSYAERSSRRGVPVVELKEERKEEHRGVERRWLGATTATEHHRFQLVDGEYLYYFSTRFPQEDVPAYMREEHIVAIEDYKNDEEEEDEGVIRPFNKPLNRVPKSGGVAELYNYNSGEWEENKQGVYGVHDGIGARYRSIPQK